MTVGWATVALMALSGFLGAAIPALLFAWRLSAAWTRLTMTVTENTKDIEANSKRLTSLETRRSGVW